MNLSRATAEEAGVAASAAGITRDPGGSMTDYGDRAEPHVNVTEVSSTDADVPH
jgi:hypothetical protein